MKDYQGYGLAKAGLYIHGTILVLMLLSIVMPKLYAWVGW